jgi:hypothetical protein
MPAKNAPTTNGIDAHRARGDLVIVDGDEAAAIGGIHHGCDDINGDGGEGPHPEEIRIAGNAFQAAGRADTFHVLQNHADDFTKAQRDDGQIIAPQAQRRHAHREARQRRQQSTQYQRTQEQKRRELRRDMRRKFDGNFRRRVSAHRHKTRVAQRELSRVTVDEIEADGEDDVDADINRDAEIVAVEVRGEIRHDRRHENGGEQKSFGACLHFRSARMEDGRWRMEIRERDYPAIFYTPSSILVSHTFSTVDLPSSPAGLTIRIKIKIAKAMPSR